MLFRSREGANGSFGRRRRAVKGRSGAGRARPHGAKVGYERAVHAWEEAGRKEGTEWTGMGKSRVGRSEQAGRGRKKKEGKGGLLGC